MRSVRIALFLLLAASPACAGDGIEAVSALWSDFVTALRNGEYPRAYGLFSAESREVMSYDGFIREYGPLTLALEMVLAKPESRSTRLDGEWAELAYGGYRPGSGRPFRVVVAAVRNQGVWALVAGRNQGRERAEAAARSLLLALADPRTFPDAADLAAGMTADSAANHPVLRQYRIETDGGRLRALPLNRGLRAFHVDAWGRVREGVSSDAPPEKAVAAPPPVSGIRALGPIPELGEDVPPPRPPAAAFVGRDATAAMDGLPELAEPSIPTGLGAMGTAFGEMPELSPPPALFDPPPTPGSGGPTRLPDPEWTELPDIVG